MPTIAETNFYYPIDLAHYQLILGVIIAFAFFSFGKVDTFSLIIGVILSIILIKNVYDKKFDKYKKTFKIG